MDLQLLKFLLIWNSVFLLWTKTAQHREEPTVSLLEPASPNVWIFRHSVPSGMNCIDLVWKNWGRMIHACREKIAVFVLQPETCMHPTAPFLTGEILVFMHQNITMLNLKSKILMQRYGDFFGEGYVYVIWINNVGADTPCMHILNGRMGPTCLLGCSERCYKISKCRDFFTHFFKASDFQLFLLKKNKF